MVRSRTTPRANKELCVVVTMLLHEELGRRILVQ